MIASLPPDPGRILDVECGLGASTARLVERFPAARVTAVNIAADPLEECRRRLPVAEFLQMDAVQLELEDATFDAILCVESAFHFDTRERFLREALRVLKPGGRLALSDILSARDLAEKSPLAVIENHLDDPGEYESLLVRIGFAGVSVVNATQECAASHFAAILQFALDKVECKQLDVLAYDAVVRKCLVSLRATRYYLLVGADKRRAR